jgi:hypothetical protein
MAKNCSHRKIQLAYPKHWPTPEDLLNFIESAEFSSEWAELGLDDEDDMVSLQLCIMSHPDGDDVIEGSHGLRRHRHAIQGANRKRVKAVTVYYGYFPDFGIVYMNCVEEGRDKLQFSDDDLAIIAESLRGVEAELERLKTIRIRDRSVASGDGDK